MSSSNDDLREQLNFLLTLSNDNLDKLMSFIFKKSKDGIYYDSYSESESQKILGENSHRIKDVFMALYNLANLSSKLSNVAFFERDLKQSGLEDTKIKRIQNIVSKMERINLMEEFYIYRQRTQLENAILPRLRYINLTTSYRVLTTLKDQKNLIPVIQCVFGMRYPETDDIDEVECQFTPNELDKVIKDLTQFKSNMQKDNEIILSKFRTSSG